MIKIWSQMENVCKIVFGANSKKQGFRTKLQSVEPWLKERTQSFYQAEDKRVLSTCTKGECCSFLHKSASGNRMITLENARGSGPKPADEQVRKGNEQTSSSVPEVRKQTNVKSSTSPKARPATRAKIPCAWWAKCKRSSCDFRHPPVCRNYKSERRCIYGHICSCRNANGEEKCSKMSKKESTGAVAIQKHGKAQGFVSQN